MTLPEMCCVGSKQMGGGGRSQCGSAGYSLGMKNDCVIVFQAVTTAERGRIFGWSEEVITWTPYISMLSPPFAKLKPEVCPWPPKPKVPLVPAA
jgi:hypothetical protein